MLHGRFERDQRNVMPTELRETLIQAFRFRLKQANVHVNSTRAQSGKSLARDLRIRILHGADHARDSGADHGVRAGTCSPLMRARFKVEVERSATRARPRLLNRDYLRVLQAIVGVRARTDYTAPRLDDDRSHRRIWRYQANAGARQIVCLPHELFVSHKT